jgi:hypothetical protein
MMNGGAMPTVQMPLGVHPRQIEFGEGVERSMPGALYFMPGAVKKITKDEFEWIKLHEKRFANLLVVISKENKTSRFATNKSPVVVKRPKDVKSKAKQHAEEIMCRPPSQPSKKQNNTPSSVLPSDVIPTQEASLSDVPIAKKNYQTSDMGNEDKKKHTTK